MIIGALKNRGQVSKRIKAIHKEEQVIFNKAASYASLVLALDMIEVTCQALDQAK